MNQSPAQAAELTPTKLAPLIREFQPPPARRGRWARAGGMAAAA
jgi:hypothetical protein